MGKGGGAHFFYQIEPKLPMPPVEYMRVYNAESLKQDSKRFHSQVKTKHFAHLGI